MKQYISYAIKYLPFSFTFTDFPRDNILYNFLIKQNQFRESGEEHIQNLNMKSGETILDVFDVYLFSFKEQQSCGVVENHINRLSSSRKKGLCSVSCYAFKYLDLHTLSFRESGLSLKLEQSSLKYFIKGIAITSILLLIWLSL